MNRSFSRVASLCSRHRAPDTSGRGARAEPAPRSGRGGCEGLVPACAMPGAPLSPPHHARSPEPCTEPGLGSRGPGAEGGGKRVQPSAPSGQLGQRPGNRGRGWDSKPEEQAWALPNPVGRTRPGIGVGLPGKRPVGAPPLPPRARLGAPSAGSDLVWGLFHSGPHEFSTVK